MVASIAIYMDQLPPEKIVVLWDPEAKYPYLSLRLAKARAATPTPRRAAVEPLSGTELYSTITLLPDNSYVPMLN